MSPTPASPQKSQNAEASSARIWIFFPRFFSRALFSVSACEWFEGDERASLEVILRPRRWPSIGALTFNGFSHDLWRRIATETHPRWLGVVGTVFRPQFHLPYALTRKFTSFKMCTDNGVNDVLKVLKIRPHVGRECSIARRLLHGGLDAGLLAFWNATESNS